VASDKLDVTSEKNFISQACWQGPIKAELSVRLESAMQATLCSESSHLATTKKEY